MTEHATVTPHAIRHRAHEKWLQRGRPEGSPEQDWLEAERELEVEAARAALSAQASTHAPQVTSAGVVRRRAPRSIGTHAGAARLLAALVPEASTGLGPAPSVAGRGRR